MTLGASPSPLRRSTNSVVKGLCFSATIVGIFRTRLPQTITQRLRTDDPNALNKGLSPIQGSEGFRMLEPFHVSQVIDHLGRCALSRRSQGRLVLLSVQTRTAPLLPGSAAAHVQITAVEPHPFDGIGLYFFPGQ